MISAAGDILETSRGLLRMIFDDFPVGTGGGILHELPIDRCSRIGLAVLSS
jgi:hypothetical protein